jgi:predicted nuclease of predicted toxin-antitoxin system
VNFVADESVDQQIVVHLRKEGHAVQYIVETGPGASDADVLELAKRKGAILLTADKDFGEMVFRQRRVTEGVIFIRLAGQSQKRKSEIVASAVKRHGEELFRAFSVITPRGIRIRKPIDLPIPK